MTFTVTATAPVRVCDLGGWTDTWFAERGVVVSVAVRPGATARVVRHRRGERPQRVELAAPDLPGEPDALLWAVIDHVGVPDDADLEVVVSCGVPPGASMGTSAAVTVALLSALRRSARSTAPPAALTRRPADQMAEPPHTVAAEAHAVAAEAYAVEVGRAGREGGVQDQVAAAYGGVNRIDIDPYPSTRVTPIRVPDGLGPRLRTVYVGVPHRSAEVHAHVIETVAAAGPSSPALARLRRAAEAGFDALLAGDLARFGRAMSDNTDAQADLAPGVVGADAIAVIALARAHHALGWKVNGAGGAGGTVTVLLPRPEAAPAFDAAAVDAGYTPLAVDLSPLGVTRS